VTYGVSSALSRRFGDYTTEWIPGPSGVFRCLCGVTSHKTTLVPGRRQFGQTHASESHVNREQFFGQPLYLFCSIPHRIGHFTEASFTSAEVGQWPARHKRRGRIWTSDLLVLDQIFGPIDSGDCNVLTVFLETVVFNDLNATEICGSWVASASQF